MSENFITTEHGYNLHKRNYNKMAILSEILNGKEVIIMDDGEEYKSLCDNLGVEYSKTEQIN